MNLFAIDAKDAGQIGFSFCCATGHLDCRFSEQGTGTGTTVELDEPEIELLFSYLSRSRREQLPRLVLTGARPKPLECYRNGSNLHLLAHSGTQPGALSSFLSIPVGGSEIGPLAGYLQRVLLRLRQRAQQTPSFGL